MNEHLFIGDTTYPHDSRAAEWLRSKYGAYRGHHAWRDIEAGFNAGLTLANSNAADRIEQLERELAESKKRTSCGYELTLQLLKITPLYLKKGDFIDRPSMVHCIVEWRKQIDKIDAAILEGKA